MSANGLSQKEFSKFPGIVKVDGTKYDGHQWNEHEDDIEQTHEAFGGVVGEVEKKPGGNKEEAKVYQQPLASKYILETVFQNFKH